MALTKREFKPNKLPERTKFTMVCKILNVKDGVIRVQRHGTNHKFGIDTKDNICKHPEGSLIECDFTISSYIDNQNEIYRYKLRYLAGRPLPSDLGENLNTFFGARDEYEITDVIGTEVPTLNIVVIKNKKTSEKFFVTHMTKEEVNLGRHMIDLDIQSLSSVIGTNGVIYENKTVHKKKDENGEEVFKTYYTYYPTLKIKSILSLESHAEGGSSESI